MALQQITSFHFLESTYRYKEAVEENLTIISLHKVKVEIKLAKIGSRSGGQDTGKRNNLATS